MKGGGSDWTNRSGLVKLLGRVTARAWTKGLAFDPAVVEKPATGSTRSVERWQGEQGRQGKPGVEPLWMVS